MPEQIWDAVKWMLIISAIGLWIRYLGKWFYSYYFGEDVDKKEE